MFNACDAFKARRVARGGTGWLRDERRGERLVVLFVEKDCGSVETLRAAMDAADLPNLWKPGPNAYFAVEAIPVLANGKLDLAAVRSTARKCAGVA